MPGMTGCQWMGVGGHDAGGMAVGAKAKECGARISAGNDEHDGACAEWAHASRCAERLRHAGGMCSMVRRRRYVSRPGAQQPKP